MAFRGLVSHRASIAFSVVSFFIVMALCLVWFRLPRGALVSRIRFFSFAVAVVSYLRLLVTRLMMGLLAGAAVSSLRLVVRVRRKSNHSSELTMFPRCSGEVAKSAKSESLSYCV